MQLPDPTRLTQEQRLAAADHIRRQRDFDLPPLEFFNADPCKQHEQAEPSCRQCGMILYPHQRVGVAWLYMRGKGLVADQVGLGKTGIAAALIAAAYQNDEGGRAVVICRAAAVPQWIRELNRLLPCLAHAQAVGDPDARLDIYLSGWDVLVISAQMFLRDRDRFDQLNINLLIADDVDPLRTYSSRTAYAFNRLAERCDRVVILTATALQKRLEELYSVLAPLGGRAVFGPITHFRQRYLREELVRTYNRRLGRMVTTKKVVGHKNMDEFVGKIRPLTVRRTADDVDSAQMPAFAPPNDVYLDLYPAQKRRYDELRKGVLKVIRGSGEVSQAKAAGQFLYGAQICAGLPALGEPDGPGVSVKLDWVQEQIVAGDLEGEKVVVFARFTRIVEALSRRLDKNDVGNVVIWGREADPKLRAERVERFWSDPSCRVLIGTEAIEQSLNLQVARHLVNVDLILNAARMQQLAGRIRRTGSRYQTVYVHNLLASGTQEEEYLNLLSREQAVADFVWEEENQLFESLNPMQLLMLIGRSSRLE